jgi:diguanylate cyclase (GGDEF)-like protein
MTIEKAIRAYLNTGVSRNSDPETKQQIQVANFFGFIGYSITFIMAMAAFIRGDILLAWALFSASIIFFSSRIIITNQQFKNPHHLSGSLVTAALMVLMLYLIYTGGVKGTGPLWIYVVPPVALFFGGLRKGNRNLGLFILMVSILLFLPNDQLLVANYSFEFKSRLLYSFLTVSLLFSFYEYSRQKSYCLSQEISRKFENQARFDSLSELLNRRGMSAKLEEEHVRSRRHHSALSLIMCDIDHFKSVNDKYGHHKGDEVIAQVAKQFKQALRQHDSIARWGGEEYLFLLPETNHQQALLLAEKLRIKIEQLNFTCDQTIFNVTVSMGIYQLTAEDSVNHGITKADDHLYLAKQQGRNRSVADDVP